MPNTLTVPCEESTIYIFFDSSKIKNNNVFPSCCRFPAKSTCSIALGSASKACCLLDLLLSSYDVL